MWCRGVVADTGLGPCGARARDPSPRRVGQIEVDGAHVEGVGDDQGIAEPDLVPAIERTTSSVGS